MAPFDLIGHSGTAPAAVGLTTLDNATVFAREGFQGRTKASQKTGPESWFGVPRGGVKPAVRSGFRIVRIPDPAASREAAAFLPRASRSDFFVVRQADDGNTGARVPVMGCVRTKRSNRCPLSVADG